MYEANGKIVAECDYEVFKIFPKNVTEDDYDYGLINSRMEGINLEKESYRDSQELFEYFTNNGDREDCIFNKGYATFFKNLNIFEEPKELSDYYSVVDAGGGLLVTNKLNRIHSGMMLVSCNRWEYMFYNEKDLRILIPIHSDDLCRIINKEQTAVVTKLVWKGMKEIW